MLAASEAAEAEVELVASEVGMVVTAESAVIAFARPETFPASERSVDVDTIPVLVVLVETPVSCFQQMGRSLDRMHISALLRPCFNQAHVQGNKLICKIQLLIQVR